LIRIISDKEYDEMWQRMKGSMRHTSGDLPTYHMKGMTCLPHSGPGTPFKDEYDRLMHKALNPEKPITVRMITPNGEEQIYPEAARSLVEKLKKDRGEA
jgi:hypothetical protein